MNGVDVDAIKQKARSEAAKDPSSTRRQTMTADASQFREAADLLVLSGATRTFQVHFVA